MHFLHPRASAPQAAPWQLRCLFVGLKRTKKNTGEGGADSETSPTSASSQRNSRSGVLVRSAGFAKCSDPETSAGPSFGPLSRSFGFSAARARVLRAIKLQLHCSVRRLPSLGALNPTLRPSLGRPPVFLLIVRRFHRLEESVRSGSQEVSPHAGETNGEMRTAQNAAPFVQPPRRPPPPSPRRFCLSVKAITPL